MGSCLLILQFLWCKVGLYFWKLLVFRVGDRAFRNYQHIWLSNLDNSRWWFYFFRIKFWIWKKIQFVRQNRHRFDKSVLHSFQINKALLFIIILYVMLFPIRTNKIPYFDIQSKFIIQKEMKEAFYRIYQYYIMCRYASLKSEIDVIRNQHWIRYNKLSLLQLFKVTNCFGI